MPGPLITFMAGEKGFAPYTANVHLWIKVLPDFLTLAPEPRYIFLRSGFVHLNEKVNGRDRRILYDWCILENNPWFIGLSDGKF